MSTSSLQTSKTILNFGGSTGLDAADSAVFEIDVSGDNSQVVYLTYSGAKASAGGLISSLAAAFEVWQLFPINSAGDVTIDVVGDDTTARALAQDIEIRSPFGKTELIIENNSLREIDYAFSVNDAPESMSVSDLSIVQGNVGQIASATSVGDGTDDVVIGYRNGATLDGGEGSDTLDYSAETVRFHLDLDTTRRSTGQWSSSGDAAVDYDYISGFENVKLGSGDDYVEGSGVKNHIWGNDGQDKIFGFDGNDFLYGGTGNDILYGGADDDTIWGDNGDDLIVAGIGNDEIYGGTGNDMIYGNEGDDALAGYGGDDVLYGGAGNDDLYGQAGADTYYGGAGKDYMYSGGADSAKDIFIFLDAAESVVGSGDDYDRVAGLEVGIDEINLSALAVQSASVTVSHSGGNVYQVGLLDNADFGIVVTTTGGTLSAGDIIV